MVSEKHRHWCFFEIQRCCPQDLSGIVSGFVHRIFNACSNWEEFNKSWAEWEKILTNNQYPKQIISKILDSTPTKIISNGQPEDQNNISKKTNPTLNHWLSLEHRRKFSQNFAYFAFKLKKILPSVNILFTTNKLRNVVSNLKSAVPFTLKSRVVYKITCPKCHKTYIGQTIRHISVRAKEHAAKGTPVHSHFSECDSAVSIEGFEILDGARNQKLLLTLEALYIRQQKPSLNTEDEFRSWSLSYVFWDQEPPASHDSHISYISGSIRVVQRSFQWKTWIF